MARVCVRGVDLGNTDPCAIRVEDTASTTDKDIAGGQQNCIQVISRDRKRPIVSSDPLSAVIGVRQEIV
jgi:hypothetical protein